jgi:lysophospholipid acyltransferase (LPLAT)-like uncharacterized protein
MTHSSDPELAGAAGAVVPPAPGDPRRRAGPPQPETPHSRRARFVWAGRLGSLVLRLWGGTWRLDRDLPPAVQAIEAQGDHCILAFFHEHILALSYAYRRRGFVVLVSQSADGEYISQIIHRLGYGTVRGSSSQGGLRALLEMARHGRAGRPLSVTPDGPRGPRRVVQAGVLLIAARSGLPIVPLTVGIRGVRRLGGWDRFELPYPFTRVRVLAGEPLFIPPDLDPSTLARDWLPRLQQHFDDLEARAATFAARAT